MRVLPRALLLASGLHLVAITAPSLAWAQPAQPGPQPVPYPTLPPPVPYGQPAQPAPPAPPAGLPRGQVVGQDVIYMKNGGILRGTIVDAIPNSQARIQLATGEIATVPWQEIARIEHGSEAPRPNPPAPGAAQPPTRRPGAMVWVHVEGPEDAHLQQDLTGTGEWQTACSAPCDVQLPKGADYRIEGGGIRSSGVFKLSGAPGDHVTITVNAGSKGWFVGGIVITAVGGLVTLIGVLTGFVGSIASATSSGSAHQSADSVASLGWVTFGIGAAAVVGGILLIVGNSKTTTLQDVSPPQTGLLQQDAWRHLPTWRDAAPEQKAMPPMVGVSLWTGRF